MEYKMKFSDLFALGLGFTIGGAVFSLTGIALGMTGTSAFLVYLVGAVVIVFSMLPTIIAGSVVPRTSVSYSLSKEAYNTSTGGFYFWLFFMGRIAMAMNCTTFAVYITSVFTTINPKIVGIGVAIVFFITNYFGLKQAVKIQKIMNLILYAALIMFVVVGLPKVDFTAVFAKENFFTHGSMGFMTAISLVVFSLGGGMAVLEFGGIAENAEKNLPKAAFSVAATVAILFSAMALVGGGVLPLAVTAYKPLTVAADAVLTYRPMFYFFLIGGASIAITTTINAAYGWYSTTCLKAVDDGWMPKIFKTKNRFGSPVYLQIIWMLFGIIPILVNMDITLIIKLTTGLQILCNIIPNLALLSLPKKYPEQWRKSSFYIKSKTMLYLITIVPTIVTAILVYLNFKTYPPTVLYIVIAIIAIGVIYAAIVGKTINKNQTQLESANELT